MSGVGHVELATIGVSISKLNRALNITTYPLAYITTSFVTKKETIEKTCADLEKEENPNNCSTKHRNERVDA